MLSKKIKNIIISLSSSINFLIFQLKKKRDYVIYSESLHYKLDYIDLLNNLVNKKQYITSVITSDLDEFYDLKKKNYDVYFIGKGLMRVIVFNFLSCKFMIMTMTDIGNNINKSFFCDNYVYFFHCMHSTHKIYTPKAFDNFDIIFCIGQFQVNEIKKNEIINKLPEKKIYKTGYFYLDHLERNSNKNLSNKNTILFAPSWNYDANNLFNDHGFDIIKNLLDNHFRVIFRPHPEIIKRNKLIYKNIINRFINNNNFFLDLNPSNIQSMENSSLLITDNSSISIEFSFVFFRPVIFIDYKDKVHNKNYHLINPSTFENEFKNEVGLSISSNDICKLSFICQKTLDNYANNIAKINNLKKKFLSNISNSSQIAADYLYKNNI